MSKLLLLEDDISLVDGLKYSLKKNGLEVEIVRTVADALNLRKKPSGMKKRAAFLRE